MSEMPLATSYYDLAISQHQARDALDTQRANSVQQTAYTVVQRTRGHGYQVATYAFGVTFTREPTFAVGASLVSIDHPGQVPIASAMVLHWVRDTRGGYTGVQLVVHVELRMYASFVPSSGVTTSPYTPATPVVAHHFTFTAPAVTRLVDSTAAATSTPAPTGGS